tara:strand:- start:6467 stop:6802 length:336 start_codon:yes stop_codon:yes gene_type:complete
MVKKYIIVQTSTNKKYITEKIASYLLRNNLAACVNIIYPVQSLYKYHGSLKKDNEYILNIKTIKNHYLRIQKVIEELHNYETPEIITLDISQGSKKFLKWIDDETIEKKNV